MSRRIETGTETQILGENKEPEEYLGRLIKYIPAEIVALYLAATGIVPLTAADRQFLLWVIFALCAALTPIFYLLATRDKKKHKGPLVKQVILATIAFPVWVFAIGGPFTALAWYKGYIASILLIFVTVIFGKVKPPLGA